ncbi:septum formation protein [Salinimicrobium sediminis]|uniref:dTTP/UTP pyrophosphatase n=1 Tax=Salinimicrobium sediminis TaxID=1343891 RepID=A0A285X9S7_9FLAO|nr:Maf-like protein [Salinimicrobium sediminis]MDX1753124.1 Maf-like protein [Salinimicrobium sediminis]SOC81189.1 septum formation protein [Salinimicrobium sediminis]
MLQEKLKDHHIILASGSPRRQQFFRDLGLDFEIRLKPIEEKFPSELRGVEITNYLAELKAAAFEGELSTDDILVTSDTIVWHGGRALEKPADPAQALQMLKELSGKTHEVITSVCFMTSEKLRTVHAITRVTFSRLEEDEIQFYIDNFRPFDKAGAYGIQEWIGLIGVEHIEGSYFNVVGLPTHLVYQTLREIAE